MPELPEVETIRRGLDQKIIGLKIQKIEVLNPKSFQGDPNLLRGKEILKTWRKAKILGIDLVGNISLLFHLKMSGQIILQGVTEKGEAGRKLQENAVIGGHPTKDMLDEMPNKSTRVIFYLDNRAQSSELSNTKNSNLQALISNILYFNDQRKFGWIKVSNTRDVIRDTFISKLGPEPLEKEFTPKILKENLLKHKNWPIKIALLDQTKISGIGNIYACESLFNAKIHPTKLISRLTTQDFRLLHQGIIDALNLSLEKGGSSKQHYFNEAGEKGYYLDFAFVYDRKNKPCKICQTPIQKITLGGRGTYFCPACQK